MNDSRMLEMRSGGILDENREENELMLELSIGGIFGKSERTKRNVDKSIQKDDLNVQSKGEIQGLWRRKREEKPKKLVGFGSCGSVSGPIVENKEWLEKQHDEVLEMEPAPKKERIGDIRENVDSDSTVPITNAFVNHGGGHVAARIDEDSSAKDNVYLRTACRNLRPYQAKMNVKPIVVEIEDGGRGNCKVSSNGSGGYASSAFSDGQCSPRQGGDSRQLASTTGSPKRTISTAKSESSPMKLHHVFKPRVARMPCVSTTGNGPNGKTISGFLYRYAKSEVSIVCVCHGQLFTPGGFVEHAGGVGIVYPLKHITILPATFAS